MRLMISVVSALEAREAIAAGADLLDVKNPEEGSLGAQTPDIIREITEICPAGTQVSAAIGDMPNLPGTAALAALGTAVCGADYIKVGLYGIRSETEAAGLLQKMHDAVRGFQVSIIAAGYADYERIGALNPGCLPRVAAASGIRGCLIDTAIKDGQRLFDFLKPAALHAIARQAHDGGLLFAAAGALREEDLPLLRNAKVDIVGLRTAVCRSGQRQSPLDPACVRSLLDRFK